MKEVIVVFKSKCSSVTDYGTVNIKCIIYPNSEQRLLLNKYFGHSRFIYNWAIDYNKQLYDKEKRSLSYAKLTGMIPTLKADDDTSFLKEVDATSLQQSLKDYSEAYERFICKKGGYPTYRSRHRKETFRIMNTTNTVRFDGNKLKLGKFGWVRTKLNQKLPSGTIQSATVKRTKTGKIIVTLTIRRDTPIPKLPLTGKEIGIDVGVKDFACFSDGNVIENPKFTDKDYAKLRFLHKQVSRKKKGSKNRAKAIRKLELAYEKLASKRSDFLHKLSLNIVRDYDIICMESLNIKSMLSKNKRNKRNRFNRSICNLGWYSFIQKVKYKAEWYGKTFIQIDKLFPSSQLCSNCGYINPEVKNLDVRQWICPDCNTNNNRDLNAAINILKEGKRLLS